MDFALRCNSLKCRAVLTERAVVTTCSHIFCNACSENLGLSAPSGGNRICPACQTLLPNPDDAVSTSLNPTDDYKTSVLSGLTPSIIVECAGRALAFWCYQSTQEIVYQEYLARSLTDKYNHLNVQMDRLVNEANSELEVVNRKLRDIQNENERLRNDNTNLVSAFREKSRKHQQTQELYDRLKRKEMTAATRSAAFESVDDVLGAVSSGRMAGSASMSQNVRAAPHSQEQFHPQAFEAGFNNEKQPALYQRRQSDHSQPNGNLMPPPPPPQRRATGHEMNGLANPPPSSHRTRLDPLGHSPGRLQNGHRISSAKTNRISPHDTPVQRQAFNNSYPNTASRNSLSGYGMSAGMRVGRQQASRSINTGQSIQSDPSVRRFSRDQQSRHDRNTYF